MTERMKAARQPLHSCLIAATLLGSAPAWAQQDPTSTAPAAQPGRSPVIIAVPTPLPLPGQLKPLQPTSPQGLPADRISRANAAARIEPDRGAWLNAIQQYPYSDGALYQVYAAPGQQHNHTPHFPGGFKRSPQRSPRTSQLEFGTSRFFSAAR